MSTSWTCPKCFVGQALYPNVLADARDGLFVLCPDCRSVAIHHPHPSTAKALRKWARRVVQADVEMVCRAVAREARA